MPLSRVAGVIRTDASSRKRFRDPLRLGIAGCERAIGAKFDKPQTPLNRILLSRATWVREAASVSNAHILIAHARICARLTVAAYNGGSAVR